MAALETLKQFKADNTLRSAAFSYIGSQLLGKRERDGLSNCFRFLNKKGDGKLTINELRAGYQSLKKEISEEQVTAIFTSIDTDNSGEISFSEYLVAAMTEKSMTSQDKLMAAFRMFDKDGSGLVSSEELSEILSAGGTADFESMIKEYDDNGDGQISFDEFATMMKRLEKWAIEISWKLFLNRYLFVVLDK